MQSLHHTGCIIEYFANRGFQLSPEVIPYFQQQPKAELDHIVKMIDRKFPNTLVISFQTVADVTSEWIVIFEGGV